MAKPKDTRPVLSIMVRRFRHEVKADLLRALGRLQAAAADHPGYLGDHNSLSEDGESCELVNVFSFDSRTSLEGWEASGLRQTLLAELDQYPQETTRHTQFDDLAQLLHPVSTVSKIEIVAILIFWILLLGNVMGRLADSLLPANLPPVWRSVLLVSTNVMLISYLFLPWSSKLLTRLKRRIPGRG